MTGPDPVPVSGRGKLRPLLKGMRQKRYIHTLLHIQFLRRIYEWIVGSNLMAIIDIKGYTLTKGHVQPLALGLSSFFTTKKI